MKKAVFSILIAVVFLSSAHSLYGAQSSNGNGSILTSVKDSLDEWLGVLDTDLKSSARYLSKVDLNSKEALDIIKGLCIARPYVIDAVIMDKNGKSIAVRTPGGEVIDDNSLRAQEDAVQVEVTKRPAMSLEFRSVGNKYTIVFEYPIFSDKGDYLGSVSLLVDRNAYLSNIIRPIIRKKPFKIWLMQPDGNMVYSEYPEFIDKNLFTDSVFMQTDSLREFAKKVASEKSGEGSYDYHDTDSPGGMVKRIGAWDTTGLYDNYWRVVVVNTEN